VFAASAVRSTPSRHNVENHPAANTDDYTFQTPDFAARVHFIVIGRIGIERRLMSCFCNQAYRLLLQNANLAGFHVRVPLFGPNRFHRVRMVDLGTHFQNPYFVFFRCVFVRMKSVLTTGSCDTGEVIPAMWFEPCV